MEKVEKSYLAAIIIAAIRKSFGKQSKYFKFKIDSGSIVMDNNAKNIFEIINEQSKNMEKDITISVIKTLSEKGLVKNDNPEQFFEVLESELIGNIIGT